MEESTKDTLVFFVVRACSCFFYVLPSILPYLISFFRETDPSFSRVTVLPVFLIGSIGYFFAQSIISSYSSVLGIKGLVVMSFCASFVFFQMMFWFSSLIWFYAITFLVGVAQSLTSACTFLFFQAKYKENAKAFFGKCVGGDVFGIFFWVQVSNLVINPRNLKASSIGVDGQGELVFPKEVYFMLPRFIFLYSFCNLCLVSLLITFVKNPKPYEFSLFEIEDEEILDETENTKTEIKMTEFAAATPDFNIFRKSFDFVQHSKKSNSNLKKTKPEAIELQAIRSNSEPAEPVDEKQQKSPSFPPVPTETGRPQQIDFESAKKAMSDPKFKLFFIVCVLMYTYVSFYTSLFKVMGLAKLNNDNLLSCIFALGALLAYMAEYFSDSFFKILGLRIGSCLSFYLCLAISFLYYCFDDGWPYMFNWLHVAFHASGGILYLTMFSVLFHMYEKEKAFFLSKFLEIGFVFANVVSIFVNTFFVDGENYRSAHIAMMLVTFGGCEIFRRNVDRFEIVN